MSQQRIPAVFIRGGTSKGVFFHARDLPRDQSARDQIFLEVLGSPDRYQRQLDGLGGGISSLSKAVVIAPSDRPDADIDYTFAQVAVDRPVVDYASTCGNLSAAVGPFAIDEALLEPRDGEAVVRVFNTNTSKVFHARFEVQSGKAITSGDQTIPGVSGAGAPIALEFLEPGGSRTSALLPTGAAIDTLTLADGTTIEASLVDATNPVVFIRAADIGADISRRPADLDSDRRLMEKLEAIRRAGAVKFALARSPGEAALSNPKIAMVAPPGPFEDLSGATHARAAVDICARAVSMGNVHRALPLTLAMCLATACKTPATIPHLACSGRGREGDVRIANPSGVIVAGAEVLEDDDVWTVRRCRVVRTQRRLMEGHVLVKGAK